MLTEIETMRQEEVQRLLLHADAYAFGMLVMEILTGFYPVVVYKNGRQVKLDDANVESGKLWNVVGIHDRAGVSRASEFGVEEGGR